MLEIIILSFALSMDAFAVSIGLGIKNKGDIKILALKAGLRVHIRAGYSNDPNQLTPIFNGVIRETSGLKDRVIECVAESYSSELLDSYMGPAKAISLSGRHHASTGLVLAYALLMDNINHFGAQIGRFQLAKAWMGSFVGAPVDLWQSFFQSAFGISNKAALAGIGIASGALLGASIGSLFGPVGTLVGGAAGGIWAGFSILKSPATDENGLTYNTQEQAMSDNIFGGKGRRGDFRDPENKALVAAINWGEVSWPWEILNPSRGNLSQRLFMNVYADAVQQVHDDFSSSLLRVLGGMIPGNGEKGLYGFYTYRSSTWSIAKEMEYRHPGTLVKPLWYDDHQTLFFGTKEQLYVARDLNPVFMLKCGEKARYSDINKPYVKEYLAERHKRLEPATGFHLLSTKFNILSNGMGMNRNFATRVNISYYDETYDANPTKEYDDSNVERMTIDENIRSYDIRETTIDFGGPLRVHGSRDHHYGRTDLFLVSF